MTAIAGRVPPARRIQVGAEDYSRADAVLDCVLTTAGRGLADRVGVTVQANLHRSGRDLDRLALATHDGVLWEALLAALGCRQVEHCSVSGPRC